jgi:hypothetical protein
MTHIPAGKDGERVTARSKGKVERPFRTVKEAHETLYHLHKPETEQQANEWLLRYLMRYIRQDHRSESHSRIEQKQELFPWTHTNTPKADLIGAGFHDVLRIATGTGTTEEVEILAWPNPTGLPLIIEHLRGIQSDTAAQVGLLERASRAPGAFTDIEATQMTTAYCVQRADLVGYQRILTVWRDTQPAPSVKRVIGHWLGVLAEIEADTKAVLNILVSCR